MSSFLPHRRHYGLAFSYSVDPGNGAAATTVAAVFPNDKYDALATEPTWAHHRFIGWFDQAGMPSVAGTTSGNAVSSGDQAVFGRSAVYAQWQLPTAVAFDAADGSMDPWSADYYEGQAFGTLPVATKAGQIFDGWFLGGTRVTAATLVPVGGATLVAQFVSVQEVEYLQSNGVAYIDTGIVPSDDLVVFCTFEPVGSAVTWGCYFGTGTSDNPRNNILGRHAGSDVTDFNPWFGQTNYDQCHITVPSSGFRTVELSYGGAKYNGTSYTISSRHISTARTMYLFSANNNGSWRAQPCRIKAFSVMRNGEYVMDLVPVRIGTTGYMRDRASGNLLGSVGSGAFTYGPDVAEGGS